jgi:PTS system fructose-specific IIA component/PTS system nitrogen regulatory IIA component
MTRLEADQDAAEAVPLTSVFSADCVQTLAPDADKNSVLRQLVGSLVAAHKVSCEHGETVIAALAEREQLGTTGLGKGIAIPHLRTDAVDECVGAIGVAPEGIDFKSLDGSPTRLVFLVLSPSDRQQEHVAILSRLARLFCDRTLQYWVQIPRTARELFAFLGL